MSDELLVAIVAGVLSGGLGTGVAAFIRSRSEARRNKVELEVLEDRAPAERDSIVAQATEAAVLSMDTALRNSRTDLDNARTRIKTLEDERDEDRATIQRLQDQLREVSLQAEHAEQAAAAAREQAGQLQHQLDEMQRTYERRANGN